MLVTATIFLGSALVFFLIALYGAAHGELYSDSPENMRLRVAHQRWSQDRPRLARDHG